jgi:hypothetical protein
MPVISLPEYLGISEAPQQPVFQRTRQVEPDSPWARTMQVADSLTALRNQRPMAQIQAIQNEYDMIRENAEKLRREREAAMQAEQAVGALFDVDGQKPDYLERKQAVLKQFPMAQFDPRVQNYIENNDRMFDAQQKAEARRQEEITTRAAELAGVGINPQEAMQYAQRGPIAVSEAKYKATQKPPAEMSPLAQRGLEEMMKLEAAGDAAGVARVNNFMVNQGIHPNPSARIIPIPEEDGMYFGTQSPSSTGTRRGGVNPVFEEYRKLYQNALEREAKAREAINEDEFPPLTDANGKPIPTKAPPQPYELESSKIVQQALQMGYDPRYNTMVPVPAEPIAGINPRSFVEAAESIANSGNRIVTPIDYSQAELTPYAGLGNQAPILGRPEQPFQPGMTSFIPSGTSANITNIEPASLDKSALMSMPKDARSDSFYKETLKRTDLTPVERAGLLEEYKKTAMQNVPIEQAGTSIKKVLDRPQTLEKRIRDVERISERADDTQKWSDAWEASKNKIRDAVDTISNETGYTSEQIFNSLKEGERIKFKVDGQNIDLKQWIANLVGSRNWRTVPLVDTPSEFTPWKKDGLGASARSDRSPPIWKAVLDDVLKNPTGNALPTNKVGVSVDNPVRSITPIQ